MAYTGAWKAFAAQYAGGQGDVQHTLDPAHAVSDPQHATVTGGGNWTETPAPTADVADVVDPLNLDEYPGVDLVLQDASQPIDRPPEGHEPGWGAPIFDTAQDYAAAMAAAHSQSTGGPARETTYPGPLRFDDEDWETMREGGPDPFDDGPQGQNGLALASARGKNSYPVNNPDGARRGLQDIFLIFRRFNVGERFHDRRPLAPNIFAAPTETPAYQNSINAQVFPSDTRFQNAQPQLPMERDYPTSFDDPLMQTIAAETPVVGAEWVVG